MPCSVRSVPTGNILGANIWKAARAEWGARRSHSKNGPRPPGPELGGMGDSASPSGPRHWGGCRVEGVGEDTLLLPAAPTWPQTALSAPRVPSLHSQNPGDGHTSWPFARGEVSGTCGLAPAGPTLCPGAWNAHWPNGLGPKERKACSWHTPTRVYTHHTHARTHSHTHTCRAAHPAWACTDSDIQGYVGTSEAQRDTEEPLQ